MSTILNFGKHEGKTLVATVFADAAWYSWAVHRGVFHDRGGPALQIEAERIWFKARHIRKPRRYPGHWRVAYYYQGSNRKFVGLMVVEDGRYEEHADLVQGATHQEATTISRPLAGRLLLPRSDS